MSPLLTALVIFFGALAALGIFVRFRPIVTRKAGRTSTAHIFHIVLARDVPYPAAVLAQEISDQRAFWTTEWLWNRKETQLRGHAREVAGVEVLYHGDAIAYAYEEAARMRSYDELSGMGPSEIASELISRLPKAREWVRDNRKILERYKGD